VAQSPAEIFNKHIQSKRHPKVQSSKSFCSRAVDRLKKGPANIPEKICKNEEYVDEDFKGQDQIFWSDYNSQSLSSLYEQKLKTGTYFFDDWSSIYQDGRVFTNNGTVAFNHPI